MALFKKPKPEEEFWKWFVKNSEEYYKLDKNHLNRLFNELDNQLSKINANLTFEFSAEIKNGKRELVISADGIKSAFPDVIKLVESAPKLDKWKITAFRPRTGWTEVTFKNIKFGVNDVFFTSKNTLTGKIDLTLFIKNYDEENKELIGAVYLLLDGLLGEYDVETKINYIEMKLYRSRENAGLKSIKELPEVIDSLSH